MVLCVHRLAEQNMFDPASLPFAIIIIYLK
jgi:hypothetical protein